MNALLITSYLMFYIRHKAYCNRSFLIQLLGLLASATDGVWPCVVSLSW